MLFYELHYNLICALFYVATATIIIERINVAISALFSEHFWPCVRQWYSLIVISITWYH
jgi:hypothetical protein